MKYSKFLVSTLVAAAAMTVPAFADDSTQILINFNSGKGTSSAEGTWNNTSGASDETGTSLVDSAGNSTDATVTWTATGVWRVSDDGSGIFNGYLDDNNSGTNSEISINVSNISYFYYDVSIYCAADAGSDFSAKTVNGSTYTYFDGKTIIGESSWGETGIAAETEGKNCITVSGLAGANLSISSLGDNVGSDASGKTRGNIAAIKIVDTYTGTKNAVSLSGTEQTWTDSAIGSADWTNSTADAGTYAAFDLSADTSVNVTGTAITTDAITASGAGTLTLSGGAISLIGPGVVRTDSDSAAIAVSNSLTFNSYGVVNGNVSFNEGSSVTFVSGGIISGNVSFGENSSVTVSSGTLDISSVSSLPTDASISLAEQSVLNIGDVTTAKTDFSGVQGKGTVSFNGANSNHSSGIALRSGFTGTVVVSGYANLPRDSELGSATKVVIDNAYLWTTETATYTQDFEITGTHTNAGDVGDSKQRGGGNITYTGMVTLKSGSSFGFEQGTTTFGGEFIGETGSTLNLGVFGATTTFNGKATLAAVNVSGGATTFNGTTDITTLNFSGGSLNFGTNAAVTVGNFEATAGTLALSSGAVNVTSALSAKGANSVINISGDSSITSTSGSVRAVDGGTINQSGGVVNALSLRIHDEQNSTQTSTFNLTGGVMNLSSENTANSTSAGVLIGHWGQGKGVLNVEGGVLNAAKTVAVVSWTSPGELNISGGEINLKGIDLTGQGTNAATVTLSDTGRLNIGANGLNTGYNTNNTKTYVFNGGTLGALDSWSSSVDVAVGGNVEIDTTKRVVNTSGASTASADSVEIALSGILSGDGGLTKTGVGTLTLSGANTFTGGVEISAGTLTAGNAAALGTGTTKLSGGQLSVASGVTLNLSALTIALGDAYSSDAAIVGEGLLTLADAATITLTKAEEAAIAFSVDEATKSYQIFGTTSLAGNFSTDNFSLGEGWEGWQISDYDSSTGVLTLSIPEPSAFGLLAGVGALALVAARRRRSRAK